MMDSPCSFGGGDEISNRDCSVPIFVGCLSQLKQRSNPVAIRESSLQQPPSRHRTNEFLDVLYSDPPATKRKTGAGVLQISHVGNGSQGYASMASIVVCSGSTHHWKEYTHTLVNVGWSKTIWVSYCIIWTLGCFYYGQYSWTACIGSSTRLALRTIYTTPVSFG